MVHNRVGQGTMNSYFIIDAIKTNYSNERICLYQYEFLESFRITSPNVKEIPESGKVRNPGL